jgi:hypothetical protein
MPEACAQGTSPIASPSADPFELAEKGRDSSARGRAPPKPRDVSNVRGHNEIRIDFCLWHEVRQDRLRYTKAHARRS